MKTIVINASPRKNWNTAMLMRSAMEGAASVGAETEYIDLYDLNFTGCRSCLACKRKSAQPCRCYWKDDLSPLIDRIYQADALLIGTPIYWGEPTSQYRALLERLLYVASSFKGAKLFNGSIQVGIFYTMNAPEAYYTGSFRQRLEEQEAFFKILGGEVVSYAACDTLQVEDYEKYDFDWFNPEKKHASRRERFPKDLKEAYRIGAELSHR